MLDQRPKEARTILERYVNEKPGTFIGVLLALACDMDGDPMACDAALKKVRDQPKPNAPKAAALFGIIGEWLKAGDKSPLDLNRLNEILEAMPASPRANSYVFAGVILDRHGKPDVALDYLKRANDKECLSWFRLIAVDTLRARQIDPGPFPW